MMDKITIIVPVYNVEQYLPKCIDSILAQTFTYFELLLIDDGSPDNSGQICDEYATRDLRIKVFHKDNGGVSSARNMGLHHAIGEWIYFIDADDELFVDSLQSLYEHVNKDIDMIMGGYERITNSQKNKAYCDHNIKDVLSKNDAITNLFKPTYYPYQGYLWNKLFRRSAILDLRFNESISFNEDRLFCFEYLCNSTGKTTYITKPIYRYFIRETSAMSSLTIGFNKNFYSDFHAYILMYDMAIRVKVSAKNAELIKRGLISSYLRIIEMMELYSYVNIDESDKLYNSLFERVGKVDYNFFVLRRSLILAIKSVIKNISINSNS